MNVFFLSCVDGFFWHRTQTFEGKGAKPVICPGKIDKPIDLSKEVEEYMETNFIVAQNDFYGSPLTNQRPIVANLNNDLQKKWAFIISL